MILTNVLAQFFGMFSQLAPESLPNQNLAMLSDIWLIQFSREYSLGRDGKERTFFIFLHPNNPKLESQGLKNICRIFWAERD
jgi:hypothetical protein